MARSEPIAALAARFTHLTAKDAEIAVKEILDAIGNSLAHGCPPKVARKATNWLLGPSDRNSSVRLFDIT